MAYAYSQEIQYTGNADATDGLIPILIGAPGSPGSFHVRADGAQNWPIDLAVSFDGGTTLENFVRLRGTMGPYEWVCLWIPHDLTADGTITVLWGDSEAADYHDASLAAYIDDCEPTTNFVPQGNNPYFMPVESGIFGLKSDDDNTVDYYALATGLSLPATGTVVTTFKYTRVPSSYWNVFGIFEDETWRNGAWFKLRGYAYFYATIWTDGTVSESYSYDSSIDTNNNLMCALSYYTDKIVIFCSGNYDDVAPIRTEKTGTLPTSYNTLFLALDSCIIPGVAVFDSPREVVFPTTPLQPYHAFDLTSAIGKNGMEKGGQIVFRLSGVTQIDGNPASCELMVVDTYTNWQWPARSAADGTFTVDIPKLLLTKGFDGLEDGRFLVVCRDPNGQKNAKVVDRVTPVTVIR